MKLLHLIIAVPLTIFGSTFLFWAGIAFEHRPAGWPNYAVHAHLGPIPINWTLRLPDSPAAKLAALQAQEAAMGARVQRVVVKQTQIVTQAAQDERKAQARIEWRTKTQLVEIPHYVTPAVDAQFRLPVGLLRVHDAAVLGVSAADVPAPFGRTDEEASDVRPSDAAAVFTTNYGVCRSWAEQLTHLQDVLIQLHAAANTPP